MNQTMSAQDRLSLPVTIAAVATWFFVVIYTLV